MGWGSPFCLSICLWMDTRVTPTLAAVKGTAVNTGVHTSTGTSMSILWGRHLRLGELGPMTTLCVTLWPSRPPLQAGWGPLAFSSEPLPALWSVHEMAGAPAARETLKHAPLGPASWGRKGKGLGCPVACWGLSETSPHALDVWTFSHGPGEFLLRLP